jgi:hypothetical protein
VQRRRRRSRRGGMPPLHHTQPRVGNPRRAGRVGGGGLGRARVRRRRRRRGGATPHSPRPRGVGAAPGLHLKANWVDLAPGAWVSAGGRWPRRFGEAKLRAGEPGRLGHAALSASRNASKTHLNPVLPQQGPPGSLTLLAKVAVTVSQTSLVYSWNLETGPPDSTLLRLYYAGRSEGYKRLKIITGQCWWKSVLKLSWTPTQ